MTALVLTKSRGIELLQKHLAGFRRIPEGCYALRRQNEPGQIDFLRLSFPKRGQFRNTLKVQSYHSDALELEIMLHLGEPVYPCFSRKPILNEARFAQVMFNLMPNHMEAGLLFAQEKHQCCRCAKKLTQERSRYYGIGPECEKSNQDLLDYVDETKGEYYEGKTIDDELRRELMNEE